MRADLPHLTAPAGLRCAVALELVDNFAKTEEAGVADSFFQQYTVRLVTDIFSVLVDPDHKSGTALLPFFSIGTALLTF